MRSRLGDKERLGHILDSIKSIELFCEGITFNSFQKNYMLQLAVVKLLEVIGEASSQLSKELREEYSEIEWKLIIGSRNILIHEYFSISYDIVWEAVQNDLPALKKEIVKILGQKFGT
jgi:uncharacterized protein with HEPN domain